MKSDEVILIISPDSHVGQVLKLFMVEYVGEPNILICVNAQDAFWVAADLNPTIVIIDNNETVAHSSGLIHKFELCDKRPHIIILVSDASDGFINTTNQKFNSQWYSSEISILPFEKISSFLPILFAGNAGRAAGL